jgi:GAF domain-containing protein
MRWPLRRQLYLTVDNDNTNLRPVGVEGLLGPTLERALMTPKATGAAIALSVGKEMICLAAQGTAPELGMRVDQQSGFSGLCVRKGRILLCDDTETDPRVDRVACQRLGVRSMIAVPLLGREKAVGILEVFSGNDHAFDDNDIRQLDLLAKTIVEATAELSSSRKTA